MRILTSTTIAVSLSLALINPSFAVSLITNRADLNANDSIDWSSLGKVLNPFNPNFADFLGFSFSGTSAGGLGLDVDINPINLPITPPFVFKTAPIPQGIPTNFANGDFLLFTGLQFGIFPAPGNPGPISISFAQPVRAAGAQIAVDDEPNFVGTIKAFDINDNLLDSFSVNGTSSTALDNSAIFLGVKSALAEISRIEFSSDFNNRAIGINTLSIDNPAIPEPSLTMAILVMGSGLLCLKKRL
ncbi:MAG: hypothetical protein EWV92_12025 [Microcystis aeruginosa Ma_MB_S_20031200_S102]|uniref:PEP-CTERM sorting domain-containing protein n=1 Tax=Microcystis aeruginosa Ma_MB_S_20031200_S102 TaxID=2486254 RepID=A0A552EQF3_MICAE|nr:MAG: hypothetical protein EWV79_21545 [Microcystis aeruginosa Ma_MB_S_20031200_S102D]TRU36651.1 MAG: hypothetical protein EWV92_12025 [Microcystis aeruginosa Ma_MB_S_20031200_S102]